MPARGEVRRGCHGARSAQRARSTPTQAAIYAESGASKARRCVADACSQSCARVVFARVWPKIAKESVFNIALQLKRAELWGSSNYGCGVVVAASIKIHRETHVVLIVHKCAHAENSQSHGRHSVAVSDLAPAEPALSGYPRLLTEPHWAYAFAGHFLPNSRGSPGLLQLA